MQVVTNQKDEIISYVAIGEITDGIAVAEVPDDFVADFKPRLYMLVNGVITTNQDYQNVEGPHQVVPTTTEQAITALAQENGTLKAELSTVEQALTALATSQGGEK